MKFLLAALLATSSLTAVLPPLYESLREYTTLLNDPALTANLNAGEWIQNIKLGDNGFEITTNKGIHVVKVIREAQERPGPTQFHLEWEK